MQPIEQPVDRMVVGKRILNDVKMRRRNVMGHEPQPVSVRGTDAAAGSAR